MSILRFKKVNCKNCYKCVRYCPVKAIQIKNHQAQIIDEECILCGNCTVVCPQNAKEDISHIPQIKELMESGRRVVASVAPSYIAEYGVKYFTPLRNALKKLGFESAYETAEGAYIVKSRYEELVEEGKGGAIISSCCPVIVQLIEKKYPQLLPQLAPVLSPMQAHAKLLKEKDPEAAVVFIGPCISKKAELLEEENFTDYVVTFDELDEWLEMEDIDFEEDSNDDVYLSRFFPVSGGILATMRKSTSWDYVSIDNIENCERALQEIAEDCKAHTFIEMSACINSCIGGTSFQRKKQNHIAFELAVQNKATGKGMGIDYSKDFNIENRIETKRIYCATPIHYELPSEEQTKEILRKMGKSTAVDELNCGTCGYDTCREKAVAIHQHKAEISMCLPFMKERAESVSDKIVNASPNLMITVDMDLDVVQINQTAMDVFGIKNETDIIGFPVSRIMDEFSFVEMIAEEKTAAKKYPFLAEYNVYLAQDFIYDKANGIIVCIMKNITKAKNRKNKIRQSKLATANMADKLVDEQLRIVHEIASLLGETAAGTKVAVEDLKNAILLDEDDEVNG